MIPALLPRTQSLSERVTDRWNPTPSTRGRTIWNACSWRLALSLTCTPPTAGETIQARGRRAATFTQEGPCEP